MAGGVEYQVTKVDPTDPETKGMVHQVHKVSEEIAATIGGKVYRARIINDPTAPTVAGKVYQIVLIDDPDDPSVKGMVYNAILTGGSEAVVVGPAVSPLSLPDAVAGDLDYVKAFGGTTQNGTPTPTVPVDIISNNGALKTTRPSGLPVGYTALEYIESTGTQYITSPITSVRNGTFYLDFQMTETPSGFPTVWGAMPASSDYKVVFGSGSQKLYSQPGNGAGYVNTIDKDTNRHQATITTTTDRETVVIDDQTFSNNFVVTEDNEMPLTFFARQRYDGVANYAKVKLYSAWHKNSNNELDFSVIPCKNPSGVLGLYDLINDQFYDNDGTGDFVAGPNAVDPITLTVVGTTETIATKANGEIVSSATAEMLLSVGDYTDEQEIISGAVTRNVGIKVLDGTEDWTYSEPNTYGIANVTGTITGKVDGNTNELICSHFVPQTTAWSGTQTEGVLNGNNNNQVFFRVLGTRIASLAAWQQWLADQYAAGTPVIVIYPLATPTTESVTGQTLQVQDGDNTLEITQASLTGLELEARYEAAVTLSVQEAEDANLDNNVTVTIE